VEEAIGAHAFGQAVDESVADQAGGLGGDIARGQAGASGGDEEVGCPGTVPEGGGDLVELVG